MGSTHGPCKKEGIDNQSNCENDSESGQPTNAETIKVSVPFTLTIEWTTFMRRFIGRAVENTTISCEVGVQEKRGVLCGFK